MCVQDRKEVEEFLITFLSIERVLMPIELIYIFLISVQSYSGLGKDTKFTFFYKNSSTFLSLVDSDYTNIIIISQE